MIEQAIRDAAAAEVRNLFVVLHRSIDDPEAIIRFSNGLAKVRDVLAAALAEAETIQQQ